MAQIRAILFDLDNTLADFIAMKQQTVQAAANAMVDAGLQMDPTKAYEQLLNAYFEFGIESDRAFSDFLKDNGKFDHKILAAAINAYLDAKKDALKPYPNVQSTLQTLQQKGIYISIVTDAPKTKAYQRLMSMRLESYFKFVIGYEDTGSSKTTGLPILMALSMLRKEMPNLSSSEVLMVGDSIEKDINPAKNLGLKTALSKYGQQFPEKGSADYELGEFKDLLSFL
jgi:putative hydrolase of the HAD superfamily